MTTSINSDRNFTEEQKKEIFRYLLNRSRKDRVRKSCNFALAIVFVSTVFQSILEFDVPVMAQVLIIAVSVVLWVIFEVIQRYSTSRWHNHLRKAGVPQDFIQVLTDVDIGLIEKKLNEKSA